MRAVLNTIPLTSTSPRLRPLVRALAAAALLSVWPRLSAQTVPAQVLPSGMQVVNGQASATLSGTTLTVRNTPDTILNWASFSIGAQNAVRFEQNSAQSQVLNRVTGNDPSAILGSLSSNGRVWLLNPNGVLFGAGARVDVAGLVVSSLNLNDADWLAGRYRFSGNAPAAVVNQGELRSSLGGRVVLLGGRVENQGDITAPGGQIVLAGGEQIELLDTGAPNLSVRLGVAAAGAVLNAGRIEAAGGRIDIHAASVNQQGIVRADALEQGPAGQIVLRATDQLELGAASRTSADGPDGGRVTLDGGAGTRVSGALQAVGRTGQGGQLTLLGDTIDLRDGAALDVSGASGGGQALIGGGAQGRDPTLRNASYLRLAPGASVRADALNRGDGGRIVLWSNLATRAYGSLSAHGGLLGGGGGWIETSGGWLDVRLARLDLSAPAGRPGLWLLDPFNILITDQTQDSNIDTSFTATGNDATISSASLIAALDRGVQVVVSTAGSGAQAGDINVTNANINVTSLAPGSLTLIADRDIFFTNAHISSFGSTAGVGGPLPVTLTAGRSGVGGVSISNSTIFTTGGDLNIGGFGTGLGPNGSVASSAVGYDANPVGVFIGSSNINVGNGQINIAGMSTATNPAAGSPSPAGIRLDNAALFGGDIVLRGAGGGGNGIELLDSGIQASHTLQLQGRGTGIGVNVLGGSALNVLPQNPDSSALLTIQGRSDAGASGVVIDSGAATFTTFEGSSTIQLGAGASARISAGNNGSGTDPALLLQAQSLSMLAADSAGTGTVAIDLAYGGQGMRFDRVQIQAPSGGITLNGRGLLDLESSTLDTGGPIRLWFDSVKLAGSTAVNSTAPGDAIVLAGPGGSGPMTSFINQAGPAVLSVNIENKGRWIVFNNDASAANFVPGGLVSDFTRYGAKANSWSTDTGNGFVFATDPTVVTATQIEPSLRGRLDIKPPGNWLSGPAATTDQRGMLDITQAETSSPSPSSTATSSDFGAIAVSDMSPQALLAVLAARDRYKKNLLADAIQQLEKKPDLADLRPCSNPKEAEEGLCLITPELQRVMQAATVTVQASVPPGAALPEAAVAATAAAPAVPAPPAAAAAARVAAAAAASALPAVPRHRVKAAALPQIRRKLALVIGVDRYADASIPPLANAVRDAKAMAHLFESTLGYDTLVLENASKAAVVRALNRMAVELGPNDSAIIYYAGHGELITSTQLGYWLLADSDARTATTWLSNTDISRLVGQIGASQVALISDSCYSGSLVSDERIRATPGQLDPDPVLAQRTVVVMSSGGNEPVFDAGKQGHSLFAWNLMQTLDQVARWQPGGRIFERVRFAVARALPQRPQYGAAKVIKHQPGNDYLFEQRSLDIGK
ncbi:MAG: caspase family protein [Leptothrix sp. (in: b-proteobacteria)]